MDNDNHSNNNNNNYQPQPPPIEQEPPPPSEKKQQENNEMEYDQDEMMRKVINESLAETNNHDIENQLLSQAMEESMNDIVYLLLLLINRIELIIAVMKCGFVQVVLIVILV